MSVLNTKKLTMQASFGLTSALLILTYSLSIAAILGQGLEIVLFCSIISALCSLKAEKNVFCGHIFLLIPLHFIFTLSTPFAGFISACLGGLIFFGLSKYWKNVMLPSAVIAGGAIGLALAGTIIVTNFYFGIGATGATPIDMLKSYRSLGFHPHFMGLLTGTITLFTMITYPFKFKKLNKYIPAEFITIFIPFILNLFLNPDKSLTTINETVSFTPLFSDIDFSSDFFSLNTTDIGFIIRTAFALGLILFGFYYSANKQNTSALTLANIFSGSALRPFPVRGYSKTACFIAITFISLLLLLLPKPFSRIPVHSIGAMLIVSGWQTLPFRKISDVIKKKSIIDFISFVACIVAFVITDATTACFICIIFSYFLQRIRKERK